MCRYVPLVAIVATLTLSACQADRQTFEEGATMETPPAVEQAPAAPFPPQPLPPHGSPTGVEQPPIDPDTFTAEHIRPADPPVGRY